MLVWRWLGAANHELAYRDSVILLNAYYQRIPPGRDLGFRREDVGRATAILVGHGHSDHIADAPYVAARTKPRLMGAKITID